MVHRERGGYSDLIRRDIIRKVPNAVLNCAKSHCTLPNSVAAEVKDRWLAGRERLEGQQARVSREE